METPTFASVTDPAPPAAGRPRFGSRAHEFLFLVYIASFPFQLPYEVAHRPFFVSDVTLLVWIAAYGVHLLRRRSEVRLRPFDWVALCYAFAMAIATATSADRSASLAKLLGLLALVLGAGMTARLVRDTEAARKAIAVWLISAALPVATTLIAIALFYAGVRWNAILSEGYGSLPAGPYARITGFFENPNLYCNFLTFTLAFALCAQHLFPNHKTLLRILAAATVASAIFSVSPGLGGIGLLLGLWWWAHSKHGNAVFLAAGIAIAAAFWFVSTVRPFAPQTTGFTIPYLHGEFEASHRALCWLSAIQTFKAHWLTGLGLGLPVANVNFLQAGGEYERLTDAHNTWIGLAAQTGIIGLIAFIGLLVEVFRGLNFSSADSEKSAINNGLFLALVCGFLYQSLHGGFETARYLWVVLGMTVGLRDAVSENATDVRASRAS